MRTADSRPPINWAAGFVQLDVTEDASVAAAVETAGGLDVLVNNAGISGGRIAPNEATAEDMRCVYETNVLAGVSVATPWFRLVSHRSESSPARQPDLD